MGGILLIGAVVISALLWTKLSGVISLALIIGCAGFALVGFWDDFIKVARHNRDGLPARWKFLLLAVVSVIVLWLFSQAEDLGALLLELHVPFCKEPVMRGFWLYGFELLVLLGSANAVNLTDGKDGLATGCTIFCCLAYAAFAYFTGHAVFARYLELSFVPGISEAVVFALAVVGGCIGFLWHNCHPAAMFMGDTGSLALGGIVGMLAVLTRQELLLLIVGGVFVMEALSVIIQVISFKTTGKRVFLCTPIHHHFERLNWTETQIVVRFWILAGIFALLALATLKLR
jgi:phospho-N-acetylmuramoyl-pentapeptide-transferase